MPRLSRHGPYFTALITLAPCACGPEEPSGRPAIAQSETPAVAPGSTCIANPLKNLYWGDLHTHTSYSLDAYAFGTRVDPAGAYAFARRAAAITIAAGAGSTTTLTIDRPLDFDAVTDHSEWLSSAFGCTNPASAYYSSNYCVNLRNQGSPAQQALLLTALAQAAAANPRDPGICRTQPVACAAQQRTAWDRIRQAADAAYVPCAFTTFPAYEWTRTTGGDNLHRNVIFNGQGTPLVPYDALSYPTVRDLWAALDRGCTASSGCSALTIPHNSNLSAGQMFLFDPADIPQMTKYQRLVEIFQHKGNSECTSPTDPADSGYDPQCNFELIPGNDGPVDRPGYVRTALGAGLETWKSRGENPLAVGFVGATDTHDAASGAVQESSFVGHLGVQDLSGADRLSPQLRDFNPGGLTAVWAEENTRESIFAALRRRETYATSGPRIGVRFYQFWGSLDPCSDPNFPSAVVGAGGVPMGGVMSPRTTGRPRFVVLAQQDARAIARIDVIKSQTSAAGLVTRVATLPNSSGSRVCVVWEDPGYDPAEPAFYYARVLEVPSERWSVYDCLANPSTAPTECQRCLADLSTCRAQGSLNYQIQETAWTSPIFQLP